MGRISSIILCLLLAAPAFSVSARGVVINADGEPVSGVKVYAVASSHTEWPDVSRGIKAAVISGPDGAFEFKSLPKPIPTLKYDFIAFTPDKYLGWTSGEGKLTYQGGWHYPEPDLYRILVSKPCVREGRVLDENGTGIAGATVRARSLFQKIGQEPGDVIGHKDLYTIVKLNTAITDEQGYYRLTGIPEQAMMRLGVSCKGYASVTSRDSDSVVMQPGGSVSGRVLDENGKPVEGVSVWVIGSDMGASLVAKKSGSDGSYIVDGLTPGERAILTESRNGVGMAALNVIIQAGKTTRVPDLICPSHARITGKVFDRITGKPAAGARVFASSIKNSSAGWSSYSKPSDSQGRYSLIAMPGKAEVSGGGGIYADSDPEKIPVRIPKRGLKSLNIKLKRADFARGKVVDSKGRPVPGAIVQAFIGEQYGGQILTDAHGGFEVSIPKGDTEFGGDPMIPPGTVVLEAKDMKWKRAIVKVLDRKDVLTGKLTLTIEPVRTLEVLVKDAKGNPLKGAKVILGEEWSSMPTSKSRVTDDSGLAVFDRIFTGAIYRFYPAELEGYSHEQPQKLLTAGSPDWHDRIEIVMDSP